MSPPRPARPLADATNIPFPVPFQHPQMLFHGAGAKHGQEPVGDLELSPSPSPAPGDRCFCGHPAQDGGIYCSVSCARSDAIHSLCYRSSQPLHAPLWAPDVAEQAPSSSAIHRPLHDPYSASSALIASATSDDESQASHYRRVAHADLRRQERREERRRRRAEGSNSGSIGGANRSTVLSTSSISSRGVPDLVGGHSRASSAASSVASLASSAFSLSRNPSTASSSSRRAYGGGMYTNSVIMEDDDEQEWLKSEVAKPYAPASTRKHGQQKSRDGRGRRRKNTLDSLPFGMGKDMRDVLEEIIHMEKSFLMSEHEDDDFPTSDDIPPPRLFTSQFGPPRTPSPTSKKRAPPAPGAPVRGHRSALSQNALAEPRTPIYEPQWGHRPPSLMTLHQSSLSESHTALYLATASPVSAGRRSASPKLETRQSITFDPDAAGPSIDFIESPAFGDRPPSLVLPPRGFETNTPMVTPSSRRLTHNRTPQAIHPSMASWRFPSPLNAVTPTRPTHAQVPQTPCATGGVGNASLGVDTREHHSSERIAPTLLWPAHSLTPGPSDLQPSLFPGSPMDGGGNSQSSGESTPHAMGRQGDMDVEMGGISECSRVSDGDGGRQMGYLPISLELEGIKSIKRHW